MTDLRTAAQAALDALDELVRRHEFIAGGSFDPAAPTNYAKAQANALRAALTQPQAEPAGAAYGIIDPDYARAFTKARVVAWSHGYALAMHGSFTRDLDLIAVPWTEKPSTADVLIAHIADATGLAIQGEPSEKPHGRRAWSLLFTEFRDPRWIDISVVPYLAPPAPPQRVPMTAEQMFDLAARTVGDDDLTTALAMGRAVEAAHGITGYSQ